MSAEAAFAAGYVLVLLAGVVALEIWGRQNTSAWASRVFAGNRRAVPDAPRPADPADWPHSEVHRFHAVIALSVAAIALVLIAAALVRNHGPIEIAVLGAVALPHGMLLARRAPRLLRRPAPPPG
ncbi:hypothetical protein DLE60_16335 [Micromonospora globispora]|uniref:hypothetical protein n=1 Tax=Micromonospora globispora TaxID=1450148 RepID=UPI000D6F7CE7|nr:hypothetical protein [Micromonospora globispora]PWU59472.1 hypothetical protein DLE60_16335 [Micromonospora globispora]